jgi:hypothetical protein
MEADWSVALAAGDPVIIVPWAAPDDDVNQCRFVDLRKNLHRIDEIEEARAVLDRKMRYVEPQRD